MDQADPTTAELPDPEPALHSSFVKAQFRKASILIFFMEEPLIPVFWNGRRDNKSKWRDKNITNGEIEVNKIIHLKQNGEVGEVKCGPT
ncbi:hypothetical protein GOZ97_07500 [Agrobacterium vitis]|uniref:hypothetical protein n=1 Tax=Agrobacterium vitis TaxID=373 RepID=UPI0012E899AF|nr:hypothetical protein [Agrobacterium vitis]MUZ53044.1 hypothetical protein [Agrobacterium vitis]MUZ91263.1 hypothetical protein [Agrobacterium vitis]MVA40293.1 hypothetical protein [Agrobacterium vitis]NSX96139.1 hypothetical protein [Agrobacterium vitis]NSZ27278.1 hypothetical protein [Agrobacterium vitis]